MEVTALKHQNPQGDVVFSANGTIHDIVQNEKIIRTFQMENLPFPVQMEFLEFEKLTDTTSKITIQNHFIDL